MHSYRKVKGKGVIFQKLPISNVNNLCCQEAWNWGGIFKCTDDHIFEKTMKIELSPIPLIDTYFVFYFSGNFTFIIKLSQYNDPLWRSRLCQLRLLFPQRFTWLTHDKYISCQKPFYHVIFLNCYLSLLYTSADIIGQIAIISFIYKLLYVLKHIDIYKYILSLMCFAWMYFSEQSRINIRCKMWWDVHMEHYSITLKNSDIMFISQ